MATALLGAAPVACGGVIKNEDTSVTYATIQDAIDAALDGHTITLTPDTYTETIVIGKAITLKSTGGAAVTTIDGGGGGTVVSFTSGAVGGATPTLEGLTITGGSSAVAGLAGGINVAPGAEAIIRSNIVDANTAVDAGAISIFGGTATIVGNTISRNSATSFASVGGIRVDNDPAGPGGGTKGTALIEGNTIFGNYSLVAGALLVEAGATANVIGNRIIGNGIAPDFKTAGTVSVALIYGEGKFLNNQITGNVAPAGDTIYFGPSAGAADGPEAILPGAPGFTFSGIEFINNTVAGNLGANGGLVFEGDPGVTPKVFVGNSIVAANVKEGFPALARDLYFFEMPGGAPSTVLFAYDLLGENGGVVGSWTPVQLAGILVFGDPATNVSPHSPFLADLLDPAFVDPMPAMKVPDGLGGFLYIPSLLGDWHLVADPGTVPPPPFPPPVPASPGYLTGSFDMASLAGIAFDIDGVPRGPGSTDMGAFDQPTGFVIPEPASLALLGIGAAALLRRRRRSRRRARRCG